MFKRVVRGGLDLKGHGPKGWRYSSGAGLGFLRSQDLRLGASRMAFEASGFGLQVQRGFSSCTPKLREFTGGENMATGQFRCPNYRS